MCNCVQKSKTPLAPGKGFRYKFECTNNDGEVKNIELDASNDNIAKRLAEDACENGLTYLSFEETDAIVRSLNLTEFRLDEKETDENPSIAENVTVLNPKTWTRVAQYGSGVRGCSIRLTGRWIPGAGHPAWDAYGSSRDIFKGTNKWCALVQVHAGTSVVATIPWTAAKGGIMTVGNFGFPTAVIIFMNDDKYDDNTNESDNPMTASVTLI